MPPDTKNPWAHLGEFKPPDPDEQDQWYRVEPVPLGPAPIRVTLEAMRKAMRVEYVVNVYPDIEFAEKGDNAT